MCVQIDRVTFGLLSPDDIEKALQLDPHMPKSRKLLAVPFVVRVVRLLLFFHLVVVVVFVFVLFVFLNCCVDAKCVRLRCVG